MKLSKQWLITGILFFALFLVDYLRLLLLSPQDVLLIGVCVFSLISSVFMMKKFYNKFLYFALTLIILVTMLAFYIVMLANKTDLLLYYLLGLIFALIIIWAAYYSHKSMDYKNLTVNYDKAIGINPNDTKSWNNKGTALVNIQMYNEAMKCFDKVLEIDPNDAVAWHNKGVNLEKLGRHKEAMKYYDKALQLDPKFEVAKKSGKIILEN